MVYKKMIKLSVLLTPLLGSLSSNAMDSKYTAIAAAAGAAGMAAGAVAQRYMSGRSQEAKVLEALNVLTLDENFMTLVQAVNKLDAHNQGKIAMAFKLVPQSRLDALAVDLKMEAYEKGLKDGEGLIKENFPGKEGWFDSLGSDFNDYIAEKRLEKIKAYRSILDAGIKGRQQARAAAQKTAYGAGGGSEWKQMTLREEPEGAGAGDE